MPSIKCEFSILGMDPKPGTLTFEEGDDFAWFVSDDGTTRTMVHREVLQHEEATDDGDPR